MNLLGLDLNGLSTLSTILIMSFLLKTSLMLLPGNLDGVLGFITTIFWLTFLTWFTFIVLSIIRNFASIF
ncbi:MAG: hypothetical protein BTN85_0789 [Candidatus Methanohalarchaeum thermophilum]|uniref:Uncharacterized protein n=1 Tax=Methanohalarchaeum thermophilum TaxID=1903181 RepID=A0A1Q6DV99_METT1|nr:MAG: hypothetical protein BTN85_0789 [Candidatus Methanohalarchaeum thermophilum]